MTTVSLALCAFCANAVGEQLVIGPIVVLLGPPGSGKTLQSAAIAKYLNVPIVSVADLVTENAAELAKVQTRGITGMEPETDPLLNKFFEARIRTGDLMKGMVLDGYPNTKDHADFAAHLLEAGLITKPLIVHLRIPDSIVRKRLAGKTGQVPDAVEQRLKDYHRETTALKIYFPKADIVDVDGTKKPHAVTRNIESVLRARYQK